VDGAFDRDRFAFKDEKSATFSKFLLFITGTDDANVKDFELFAANDSPTGNFWSLGKFSTKNLLLIKSPYQEFTLPKTTARYFKFKVLSNYGGRSTFADDGLYNTLVRQMRLIGKLN
jgi:hypothetical protein